ncbi:MAG TPA: DUF1934 domain-containing protein [Staphylococcus sp.]|uniref:DUF1934 family protein n=1 Tax=Mammaliicoccus vitulinus TaxID=71237 RepID=A0ABX7HGX1_9STAP|nr:DUF1934 family protein [Mammaliicoccus vitulinus]HAL09148.1 DUF1934 domain-containing protein [Staphylococcus sp.]MBM6630476.1 DUF1934 family protein [Mammaliicoccus vitulinus]MBO3078193.1 DUF1934 family protein [Mammaliicoccus vitulinus]MEB7658555.1 DUF1934 family protein [Mammaliicoccus vitulinus]PNZ35707.1 DUF1934 domain-containing protein [Mammaliicoccus vitulinus]
MEENIHINIKQVVKQNGEKSTFQTNTSGTYHRRNSDIIRYEETIDNQIVKNMLKIENNGVKIHRTGAVKTVFHFVEGQETISYYDTEAGRMTMNVKTLSIKHDIDDIKGKLRIHYQLSDQTGLLGTYQFQINYKEINE